MLEEEISLPWSKPQTSKAIVHEVRPRSESISSRSRKNKDEEVGKREKKDTVYETFN